MTNKQFLSGALVALLLAGVCASTNAQVTSASTSTAPASSPQAEAGTFTLDAAGIRFTVPAEWDVKPGGDGDTVKVSPKAGGAQVALIALPAELKSEESGGLIEGLAGKSGVTDIKWGELQEDETLGGMKAAVRPYAGKNNGHDVEGMFFLLSAERPVFIVLVIEKSRRAALAKDVEALINSIKKAE
jgi:hypothetical protein